MIKNNNKEYILLILIFLTYLSLILGFFLNKNSAGAGSYNGDISWIWKNYDIYKNNNLSWCFLVSANIYYLIKLS